MKYFLDACKKGLGGGVKVFLFYRDIVSMVHYTVPEVVFHHDTGCVQILSSITTLAANCQRERESTGTSTRGEGREGCKSLGDEKGRLKEHYLAQLLTLYENVFVSCIQH